MERMRKGNLVLKQEMGWGVRKGRRKRQRGMIRSFVKDCWRKQDGKDKQKEKEDGDIEKNN